MAFNKHAFNPTGPGSPVCTCGTMDINSVHWQQGVPIPLQEANRVARENMGGDPQRMDESDALIAAKIDALNKSGAFITKDSGKRQEFESGMVRDTTDGKIEWHKVMDGPMQKRWAELLTRGAIKYPDPEPGVGNWTLASGKAELARFRASAYRHFMQWYLGETDEDHAAAVFFNINGAEYVKEKMNNEK